MTAHDGPRIRAVDPASPLAVAIVRAYLTDVASRWYGRPATTDEVDRALVEEPATDLCGDSGVLLVAVDGDRVVGCAGARFLGDVAELTKVFTLPGHRGRGTGRALVAAVEQACRDRGVTTVRLDTRAELVEACAMYERAGYEQVAAFTTDPYSDRWYRKDLVATDRTARPGRPARTG